MESEGRGYDFFKRQNLKGHGTDDTNTFQVDEVEVFGTFGGDLPVSHQGRKSDDKTLRATVRTIV